ncbi:MAG: hypothetical protein CVU31_05435 [Betaproteobacteria bacterium HGW-Betaproteobacteria-4]|nr:MAG: hypothetical protein CVU31_05435 [Betaproteobacteria bacterium HGW-Betaproteobacteria-4]
MGQSLVGDRVLHPNQQEWGLGKVLSATPDNLDVFFVGAGRKRLSRSFIKLEKAEGAASKHRLLDNLIVASEMVSDDYVTIPMAIDRFMEKYPNGFEDADFIKSARETNLRGQKMCAQLLSQEELSRLIGEGSFDAVCDRARHVETSANLLFLRTLGILELNKWPFATLFSFLRHPQQSAYIKPSAIQNAAKALCWRINYKPEPNWKTYDAVTRLYSYVRTNLLEEGLMPRDLVDVQAFIWSVAQK